MSVSINGTGGITFADTSTQNTGGYTGFRNRIINGAMQVWQRGASGSVVSGGLAYTADRFYLYSLGSTTSWSQASQLNVGSSTGVTALLFSGSAGNTAVNVGQRIESVNSKDLAGQPITISAWLYSSVGFTPTLYAATPSVADNYTSVSIVAGLPSLPAIQANTWTYVSATFTAPAAAVNGLDVAILFGATTSGNRYITGVQLEKGSVATPFEFRPFGTELAMCQRYYQRQFHHGSAFGVNNNNMSIWYGHGKCHVTMRTTPTASIISGVTPQVDMMLAGNRTLTEGIPVGRTPNSWKWDFGFSGGALGSYYCGVLSNDCVECSAEL